MNEIDFKVEEAEKVEGTEVGHDGFKPTNSLEWQMAECSSLCEIEANVNLVVQLKERLEAP